MATTTRQSTGRDDVGYSLNRLELSHPGLRFIWLRPAKRQDGDVVIGTGSTQCGDEMGEKTVDRRHAIRSRLHQALQSDVDALPSPLNQSVGEGDQGGSARQLDGGGRVGTRTHPQGKSDLRPEERRRGSRYLQRVQMAGIGYGDHPRVRVSHSNEHGGNVPVPAHAELPRAHLEDEIRRMPLGQVGTNGEPKASHDRRRVHSLAGHVAHGKSEQPLIDIDQAEPIAANLHSICTGQESGGDLEIGDSRIALG